MPPRLLVALAIVSPASAQGLHGYIGYQASPPAAEYSAGMGFYSAVWPLVDEPLENFQIGLAGAWILPDNSDNKDTPLAPEGTLARRWKERGPGWSFFYDTQALPDDRLGIAQVSNRILIPPDAMPFEGNPRGRFMGYTYMALPFTDPVPMDQVSGREPTGDQAWT